MKIAIHYSVHSDSKYWIEYCREKGIDYKIVDCYQSDIIDQLSDCEGGRDHLGRGRLRPERLGGEEALRESREECQLSSSRCSEKSGRRQRQEVTPETSHRRTETDRTKFDHRDNREPNPSTARSA